MVTTPFEPEVVTFLEHSALKRALQRLEAREVAPMEGPRSKGQHRLLPTYCEARASHPPSFSNSPQRGVSRMDLRHLRDLGLLADEKQERI